MGRNKYLISVLICCAFFGMKSFAQAWDGSSVAAWSQGDGTTSATAFEIASAENLAYLAQQVNGGTTYENTYFKMTADIDLGSHAWTRIGGASSNLSVVFPFKGVFDGDGHKILNLFVNRTGNNSTNDVVYGLFGYVNGGVIRNLGIESGSLEGFTQVGAVVGTLNTGTVEHCYNKASVITNRGGDKFGGIVGYMINGTIQYCYNAGNIMNGKTTNNNIGGIAGTAAAGTIQFCFNIGNVSGNNGAGGIAGNAGVATLHDCYNTGIAKGKLNFGGIAGGLSNSEEPAIDNCFVAGLLDLSERTGGYGAVLGATSDRLVNNSFYDIQLITSSQVAKGASRLTSEMTGNAINSLGENWEYSTGLYPGLVNMTSSDEAVLSRTPFILDAGDDISSVKTSFQVETSTGVAWGSSNESVISVSGTNALVSRKAVDTSVTLTATYGTASKSVDLLVLLDVASGMENPSEDFRAILQADRSLVLTGNLLPGSRIRIYNPVGALLYNGKVENAGQNRSFLNNFSAGVYLVTAIGESGKPLKSTFCIY